MTAHLPRLQRSAFLFFFSKMYNNLVFLLHILMQFCSEPTHVEEIEWEILNDHFGKTRTGPNRHFRCILQNGI